MQCKLCTIFFPVNLQQFHRVKTLVTRRRSTTHTSISSQIRTKTAYNLLSTIFHMAKITDETSRMYKIFFGKSLVFYVVQQTLENTDRIGGSGNGEFTGSPISWLGLGLSICVQGWSRFKPIWGLNGCIILLSSRVLCTSLLKVVAGSELVPPGVWHYVTMGRSSVCWVSLCLRRSTFRWNALPHRSQAKGLNPVCFLEWVMRLEDWLKALPHTVHLCGFSPGRNRNFVSQHVRKIISTKFTKIRNLPIVPKWYWNLEKYMNKLYLKEGAHYAVAV